MCHYFVEIYNSDTEKAQKDHDHKFLDCYLNIYINTSISSMIAFWSLQYCNGIIFMHILILPRKYFTSSPFHRLIYKTL